MIYDGLYHKFHREQAWENAMVAVGCECEVTVGDKKIIGIITKVEGDVVRIADGVGERMHQVRTTDIKLIKFR